MRNCKFKELGKTQVLSNVKNIETRMSDQQREYNMKTSRLKLNEKERSESPGNFSKEEDHESSNAQDIFFKKKRSMEDVKRSKDCMRV